MRPYAVALIPLLLASASSFQTPVPRGVTRFSPTRTASHLVGVSIGGLQQDTRLFSTETTEWTKKRLHNTAAFRSLALLTTLTVAGFSTKSPLKLLPNQAIASIHMLSFATWFGMVAYTTFVAGITMFKNLPRQVFGRLQAKLFPKYFALSSVTLVLQLITLKSLKAMKPVAAHNSAKCLAVALLMTLVNQFYLEPTSTENMLERYELEDAGKSGGDRYKELKANFGKFHGMSSLTNLIALVAGAAHAVYLASTLVV